MSLDQLGIGLSCLQGLESPVKRFIRSLQINESLYHHISDSVALDCPKAELVPSILIVSPGHSLENGLLAGGRLNTIRRLVRYVCPGDKVPPYLEVDISRLNIGQSIFLKDLPADPALRLVAKDLKMPVLKISGRTQTEGADGE